MATKVEVISMAPQPRNIQELRSFLGLLHYYGKPAWPSHIVASFESQRKQVPSAQASHSWWALSSIGSIAIFLESLEDVFTDAPPQDSLSGGYRWCNKSSCQSSSTRYPLFACWVDPANNPFCANILFPSNCGKMHHYWTSQMEWTMSQQPPRVLYACHVEITNKVTIWYLTVWLFEVIVKLCGLIKTFFSSYIIHLSVCPTIILLWGWEKEIQWINAPRDGHGGAFTTTVHT